MPSVSSPIDGLQIGHVNVYHLCNKLHDVSRLLIETPSLHLLGLSETRLNVHDDKQVAISNYNFFRKDAKRTGQTGMGIYVHNEILKFITRRPDLEPENVECMWLQFKRSEKDSPLLVGFVYRNPASQYSWYDDFVAMMDLVTTKHSKANYILLGDFNIDLLKPHSSWDSTLSLHGLKQLVTKPTRVTPNSATLLDHIYTNNDTKVTNVRLSDISISDHNPVACTWLCKSIKSAKTSHTTIIYRCFKSFDNNRFLADLSTTDFSPVYNYDNPNDALTVWYNTFLPVLDKHAPIRKKRVKQQTLPGWMNRDIIEAMKVRDKYRKEKQFTEYKKQRNLVSAMVQKAKHNYFEKLISNDSNTAQLWRAMNNITKKSRRSNSEQVTISPDEFNTHFLSIADSVLNSHVKPAPNSKPDHSLLEQFCKERLPPSDSCKIPNIAIHEVGRYIEDLKNKKTMGPDNLNTFIVKLSLPYIVESLTFIYNRCIKTNTFPDAWKTAKVVPLPKSQDTSDPNNFRPISILSILSKPLEKHIQHNILGFVETRHLFHDLQSGFRKTHSCHTALTKMCDTWLSAINESKMAGAIFLDFRKAFDLVDHEIIISKLRYYLNNDATVLFLSSFLRDRTQTVLMNGNFSKPGDLKVGVPQGSILGPVLFCLFINDLPLHIENSDVSCEMFADDSSLHTTSTDIKVIETNLQKELSNVDRWCSENKMAIHPQKTKSMVISSRQKHQRAPLTLNLVLGTHTVEQVETHKVLGVTIDNELRWQPHITNICKLVASNIHILGKLKTYVEPEARLMFFNAHCLSHINYASTVWCGAGELHLKKLNSLHRRAAKIIVSNNFLSTTQKLRSVNILSLEHQFEFNTAVLVYKAKHRLVPSYVQKLLTPADSRYQSEKYLIPRTRIDMFKSSFAFSGANIWNSLPVKIRACKTLSSFKSCLKKYLLKKMT